MQTNQTRLFLKPMELKSSPFRTWKLFILGCLCGGLLSLLFIDKTQQNASFSTQLSRSLGVPPSIISPPIFETNVDSPPPISSPIFEPNVDYYPPSISSPIFEPNVTNIDISIEKTEQATKNLNKCDMFDGRWVYKADDKPMYNAMTCPYLEAGVICQENGRSDFDYVKWKWEAKDCEIPLFDVKDMLERLRNKRMIIVGDSLNRNMWESLACLIYSSVPSSEPEANDKRSAYRILKAKDYNFTFEFYMCPFLIEFDTKHRSGRKVIILDKIASASKKWKGADIMLFNSGHWWTHTTRLQAWELFEYKGKLVKEITRPIAYKRAMRTWASWIKNNVDPKKTSVYFRSISPTHYSQQPCYNAMQPMKDESYVMGFPRAMTDVTESVINGMSKFRVKYLNITKLSQYRIDAHPSIYYNKIEDNLPGHSVDCSHWCLPGLPDTWNRLLYASILFDTI